jgi:hypothetical protein
MDPYSNPRMSARIENWPSGTKRVTAVFMVEQDAKRGERATRQTIDANGKAGAPKKLTYARQVRIVDGDDNRTYVAELTAYGFVSIMRGDCKFQQETIHDNDPRYSQVRALFDQ